MKIYDNEMETPEILWKYELTTADISIDDEEDMRYTTHGIQAVDPEGNVVTAFRDVSTSRDFVQAIVDSCNLHKASVIHLEDILLDEIG